MSQKVEPVFKAVAEGQPVTSVPAVLAFAGGKSFPSACSTGANASLVLALLRDWTVLSPQFYYFHIPVSLPQGDVIPGHLLLPHLKATANQAETANLFQDPAGSIP